MIAALVDRGRKVLASGNGRHYGGFVLAGVAALATDTGMLTLLTRMFGLSPFVARPFGIACAMVVSWLINRTVTFATTSPASLAEFSRFAGVSVTSQIVNYSVFAVLLLAFPVLAPELALFLACFVSMFVSYTGFRFGVFANSAGKPGDPGK